MKSSEVKSSRKWPGTPVLQLTFAWALVAALGLTGGVARAQAVDWLTFGGTAQRNGYNPAETVLSQSNVGQLRLQWSVHVGGTVQVQPLLVHNVPIGGNPVSVVFIATRTGKVAAYQAADGKRLWLAQLGTSIPCGYTHLGISGTPTIDLPNLRMFVVDALGLLHALDLATGAELAPYPIQVIADPYQPPHSQSHGSPTLIGNSLYIGTSNACPDKLFYQGQVIQVDLPSATVVTRWYPLGSSGPGGGGVWGPGGVAASADGSTLYAATANALRFNGFKVTQNFAPAESIVRLDTGLNVQATHGPITSRSGDFDFGATPLVFTPANCPDILTAVNKSGVLVSYDPNAISQGPLQTITLGIATGAGDLAGIPTFDPITNAIYIYSPNDAPDGSFHHGLIALQVNASCQLVPLWNQVLGPIQAGRPQLALPVVVANGVVWLADGPDAQLLAFADNTGAPLWNSGTLLGTRSVYASPLVINGQVFIGTVDGRLLAFGL